MFPEERFYLVLARELGMTKQQLLANISSRELTEWEALYQLEGDEREAVRKEQEAKTQGRRGY